MKSGLNKSVMITGAAVTGKTTLCRRLIVHFCLEPIPVHMTRQIRDAEIEGVDGEFIDEEEFRKRFFDKRYLQESLESAFFNGSYSGCPKEWIETAKKGDYRCFVCPTVMMAKNIKEQLGDGIFWAHLTANREIREQRLANREREIKKEDFDTRIHRGNAPVDIEGCNQVIDTSYLNAWEIFFHALSRL